MLRTMSSPVRLGLAAVMLLTATVLGLYAYGPSRTIPRIAQSTEPTPAPLMITYLVAARPLPAGSMTRPEDFTTRSVQSIDLPQEAIVDTPEARASLRGALVRNFIDAGRPISSADVLRPRDRGFLATVLAPGTRAVSIGVDAISGAAGLVWPGDYVDVVLTYDIDKPSSAAHRSVTQTVMTDVRVIATDQRIVQGASDNATAAGKIAQTVTLQIAPDQVQGLIMAAHLGKLSLSIRSAKDPAEVAAPDVPTFAGDVSAALNREAGRTVVVYQGKDRQELFFKGNN
jgi:pilus assembly protein CpaB